MSDHAALRLGMTHFPQFCRGSKAESPRTRKLVLFDRSFNAVAASCAVAEDGASIVDPSRQEEEVRTSLLFTFFLFGQHKPALTISASFLDQCQTKFLGLFLFRA